MQNRYLTVEVNRDLCTITDRYTGENITIPWDGINMQSAGISQMPGSVDVVEDNGSLVLSRAMGDVEVLTTIKLNKDDHWCSLKTVFRNKSSNPITPDYVCLAESDSQTFRAVGYKHQNAYEDNFDEQQAVQNGEEAGSGRIPGCGYPIFSENFFVGIEHVAAFTLKKETGFRCLHYPVWNAQNEIETPAVVIGVKGDGGTVESSFLKYIQYISIPKQQVPFLCCCTFWSDPYIGNNEYMVNYAHYTRYIKQFMEAGIHPEMMMLDAGWNDRNSVLQAKKEIGGDAGLKKISDYLAEHKIMFGLWSSINGNMGVSHEWAAKHGFPVGTGRGAAYSEPHQFVVLMDNDFADISAARHVQIMQNCNCKFFKIDWDCECATNPDYQHKYPTPNHVRTASIDAINRVHAKIIAQDPTCYIRNGWWPSPWWLQHVTMTWLADSGDCEYAVLPSLTQRDRETTHRDAMYYYIFKESRTPFPLDAIDNHEMTKALRNPFAETFESWCNTVMMLYMRGTIYLSVMMNAATLSDREARFFAEVKRFAEKYKHILFNKSARFIGGNPALGEAYAFLHQTGDEAMAIIRNPSITPLEYSLDELVSSIGFSVKQVIVIYPYCSKICDGSMKLLSHQTTVLYFSNKPLDLPTEIADKSFTVSSDNLTYLAAGQEPDDSFGTIQEEFAMIRDIDVKIIAKELCSNAFQTDLAISIPDRMLDATVIFELRGGCPEELDSVVMRVYHDRYPETGDGHAIPITTAYPKRQEGCGIIKNINRDEVDHNIQYRVCPIPSGGEFFLNISIDNFSRIDNFGVTMFVSGKRGRSRKGKALELPAIFANIPKHGLTGVGEFVSQRLI